MKRSSFLKYVALTIATGLLVTACSLPGKNSRGNQTETKPADNKVLKVATEPAFPPFEFQTESGELDGFDIELMRAIAAEAGFQVEFESLPFDGIIPALQAESVDVGISGMTITKARLEDIDFSRPYIRGGLAIAVRNETTDIQTLKDLENKKIGVKIGTTGADKAAEIPGAEISTFQAISQALRELANGSIDAVINDAPATLDAISRGDVTGVQIVGELLTTEYYGIAVPKESPYLELINQSLEALIKKGIYAEIYQKWFGTEPPSLPDSAF